MEYKVESVLSEGVVVKDSAGQLALISCLTSRDNVGATFCKVTADCIYYKLYRCAVAGASQVCVLDDDDDDDVVPDLTAHLAPYTGKNLVTTSSGDYGPAPAIPYATKNVSLGVDSVSEWVPPSAKLPGAIFGEDKDWLQQWRGSVEYCTLKNNGQDQQWWVAHGSPRFGPTTSLHNFILDENWTPMPDACQTVVKLRALYEKAQDDLTDSFMDGIITNDDAHALLCAIMSSIAVLPGYPKTDRFRWISEEPLYVWHNSFTLKETDGSFHSRLEDMEAFYKVLTAYSIDKQTTRADAMETFLNKTKRYLHVKPDATFKKNVAIVWRSLQNMCGSSGHLKTVLKSRMKIEKLTYLLAHTVPTIKPSKLRDIEPLDENPSPFFGGITRLANHDMENAPGAKIIQELIFRGFLKPDCESDIKKYISMGTTVTPTVDGQFTTCIKNLYRKICPL